MAVRVMRLTEALWGLTRHQHVSALLLRLGRSRSRGNRGVVHVVAVTGGPGLGRSPAGLGAARGRAGRAGTATARTLGTLGAVTARARGRLRHGLAARN